MNQEDQAGLISPDNLPPFANYKPTLSRTQMKFAEHIHPRREQQLLRGNQNPIREQKPKGFETVAKTISHQESQEDKQLANTISDQKAIAIYKKLQSIAANSENKRIKRNWHHSETHLLYWVIKSYSKEQKIDYSDFSIADWEKISQFVPGRNANQCQYKWQSNHKPKNTKAPWTAQEDNALRKIIEKKGAKSWADISRLLNNQKVGPPRQGKQCRQRWYNHVNPAIKWDTWTEWQDITLLIKQQNLGNKWSEIAKCIPGRTQNSVKNRFNSLAKKERTKIQQSNKAKKKTSAQNATDLKESMNCFFKENVGEANNDIWINPLVERLKNTYYRKHQSHYDINIPPDSDLEYLQKSKDFLKQPPKRVVIYKEDIMSSSSQSPEEGDDSSDSQFKITIRQKPKRPPPTKKNYKEEKKLPSQIKLKRNQRMTLRSHKKEQSSELQVQIEVEGVNNEENSSLSNDQQESSSNILKFAKISQRYDSQCAEEQMMVDQSQQQEFDLKRRKIISQVGHKKGSTMNLTTDQAKFPHYEEAESLDKTQITRIFRNMSLGSNPLFRYEDHFKGESSGLLPSIPKQSQRPPFFQNYIKEEDALMKCQGKQFSRTHLLLKLHLSKDALYADDGEQMFKLTNLELYDQQGAEKKRSLFPNTG